MINDILKSRRVSILVVLVIIVYLGQSKDARTAEPGEQDFNTNCGICHTIGGGRLIGPDLSGVHNKRSQEWLESFVKSSQSLINSGDADATALFAEYSSMLMPDAPFSEEQIIEVLNYMKFMDSKLTASSSESTEQETVEEPEKVITKEDIHLGQNLFQGTVRFENGGPTCNACHDVNNDAVIGGGILAAELTSVFSKMGGTGVRAILGKAPFPVMEAAYKDRALTENEIFALVSFLQDADEQHAYQHPRDYGTGLLVSGMIGATILFGFYSLLWLRRKKDSVNQEIYDRQIKSE